MTDSNRRQRPLASERVPNRVLTLRQWAELNTLSERTARHIIASGNGPKVTQLSGRRIGIREDHNAEWLDSRVRQDRA
jgi:predicted DNA-binding transcriptional regulator AlpA